MHWPTAQAGQIWEFMALILRFFLKHLRCCLRGMQRSDCLNIFSLLSLLFPPSPLLLFFPSCRFDRIAHTRETMNSDGLNTLSYKVLRADKYPLYTKITVDIGSPNS